MENSIKVKNSGVVDLQFYKDYPDGDLYIAEGKKNLPFEIKRVYFINKLENNEALRGKHAHKKLNQVIFCINGSFDLELDDGTVKQNFVMCEPNKGIILGPELWHEMKNFSKDCVILVFADDYYNESDYIRNYDDFIKYLKNEN